MCSILANRDSKYKKNEDDKRDEDFSSNDDAVTSESLQNSSKSDEMNEKEKCDDDSSSEQEPKSKIIIKSEPHDGDESDEAHDNLPSKSKTEKNSPKTSKLIGNGQTVSHHSGNLPGSFAVSLVDRNYDPTLPIVFYCWICDEEFIDKLGIIKHLKESHIDVPGISGIEKKMRVPICLICGVGGGCEHRSVEDEVREDEERDEDGDKTLISIDGIERQMRDGKFNCPLCKINFPSTYQQRDHFSKEHPNEKMYKCSYCPDAFFQHHKLVVHTRTHTGYKPYACGICGSKFPKNSDLNRHIRTHNSKGEKPFQCAQCGQTFTQKCSLEKHARRHADKDGGHPCYHCGLTFAFAADLDAHSSKEHGERTWKCTECGKLFEERRHLIVHAKTHQEGVKYQCSFCERTFSKRHQLAKHEDRIHHRQDDLKCKVCSKEFRRRENLTRHMNIHLDKRDFQCTQCGMAFTEKGSLRRHVLSRHEQHRPFKCRLCGKAFSRRFLLRKHHIRTHASFPYEGEENPVPSRGFGASIVNIDKYILCKNSDSENTAAADKKVEDGNDNEVDNEMEEFVDDDGMEVDS